MATTCTRCGRTPDQLYPSYDGPLCAPCANQLAEPDEHAEPGHGLSASTYGFRFEEE